MQSSIARYFCFTKSICFSLSLKTRYAINLVAVRQHIECVSTYRVCKTYRKSRNEIYIDDFNFVEFIIAYTIKKNNPNGCLCVCLSSVLCSRAVARQVLSALRSLTAVFGMGTGVPSALSPLSY